MANWGTCFSGSNNIHFDFPPIMADGRNFASWQAEAIVNERIQKQANITSSWEYRRYLTQNALEIMKFNNSQACTDLGLPSHTLTPKNPSSNVPHSSNGNYDTSEPGFNYNNSDLKQIYLSREQLQSRMVSPSIIPPQ